MSLEQECVATLANNSEPTDSELEAMTKRCNTAEARLADMEVRLADMEVRFAVMKVERDDATSELAKQNEEARIEKAGEVEVERQAGDQRQRAASGSFEKKAKEVVKTSLDHLKTDISESVEDTKTGIFNKLA
jgi:chromosome segregation ATPase